MKFHVALPVILSAALLWELNAKSPADAPSAADAVRSVMTSEQTLSDVPLRDVIVAATGKRILPFQPDKIPADAACRKHIAQAADKMMAALNAADSPLRGLRRINEGSRHVEDKLAALLNDGDFTCGVPRTTSGEEQRSGYPDLRIVHKPTDRIYYLDPKLYESTAAASTLRTFYYEPKALTGKINDDACHLILGIAHDGKDGAWQLTGWRLVDLYNFRVRLKAEFQASNKELYRDELIVGRSGK